MQSRIYRVDKAGAPTGLGPLESRVMDAVWSLGGWVSVNHVLDQLSEAPGEKPLAYSTIKAVLTNLADKGHLRKRAEGKANVFHAAQSRDEFQRTLIGNILGPLLKTQRNPLLAHIAGELALDAEGCAEFERLLAQKRAQSDDA